jgi:Uncharacterized protein conserved in bacteria (DUF2252)
MGNYTSNQLIPFDYVHQVSTMITNNTNILNLRYNNMLTSEYNFFTANPSFFIKNAYDIFATNNTEFGTIIKDRHNIITYNDFHTGNMGLFSDSNNDRIWSLNDYDGLSYNDINIDFARIGSSFAILNDNKIANTEYFDGVYHTFITEYISELNDLYELNSNSNSNQITTLDIKLNDTRYKNIKFLKKVKNKIISDKEFLKKYIQNDKPNKFKTSDQIINIDKNLYTTIAKNLMEKYHNIKIYDIVQKLYSGGSSFGSLRYYVYAKYSNNNIILEIKQLIPIYDPNYKLIIPKGKTIYKYTKLINAYSWTNLFNYLTIYNLDYLVRLKNSVSSTKIEEKDFNDFNKKDFLQYMQISANLLAKFHYNSLLNEKINISDYLEYLKTNTKIITNNMKAFSISYVGINKKYFYNYLKLNNFSNSSINVQKRLDF